MTEERYFITGYGDVVDRVDRAIYPTIESMVKTMNDQDQEIKEISDTLDNMVDFKNKYRDRYKETKKENERIKQTIREAYETERTAIGKSVLKQLLNSLK